MREEPNKKRILCLGDSNTYGYDPRSWLRERYPAQIRWEGLLQREDRQLLNGGQNGASIPTGTALPIVANWVRSLRPLDALLVMLGSNDLLQGVSAEEAAARMEALLIALREAAPGAAIALIAPPQMQLGEWVDSTRLVEESARLAAVYADLAGRLGIAFADASSWAIVLSHDGVHFTPAGHAGFARHAKELLESLGC